MLAVLLALGACLGWGVSDFLGGLKSRSLPLTSVLLISQSTALVLLVAVVVVEGAPLPGLSSLGQAALAGLAETAGVAALYRGLAVGRMGIVAPVAATAPVVPLVAGVVTGQVPGPLQFAGLGLALVGLVITSKSPNGGDGAGSRTLPSVGYGLLAALGFGTFFLAMHNASGDDVGWALLVARLTAVTAIAAVIVGQRRRVTFTKADLPATAAIGVLIITADFLYATASNLGMASIAAVLGSLHTVVTIALARIVLKERLGRLQQLGIAIAVVGVLAISTAT